eukprot:SAG22_NODE_73_length_22318_cov_47.105315_5_plen_249_part_00
MQVWLEHLASATCIASVVGSAIPSAAAAAADDDDDAGLSGFMVNVTIDGLEVSAQLTAQLEMATTDLGGDGESGGAGSELLEARAAAPRSCTFAAAAGQARARSWCLIEVALPAGARRPWTPETPFLYNFSVTLLRADRATGGRGGGGGGGDGGSSTVLDKVDSYAALRTVGKLTRLEPTASGGAVGAAGQPALVTRLALNGEPAYLIGTLDQGFWPESAYTAPTDAALCVVRDCHNLGHQLCLWPAS